MKRAHDFAEGPQSQFRRQQPVSCELCRSKKLRCNRESPCSNCVTREIECVHVRAPTGSSAPVLRAPSEPPTKLSLQSLHTRIQRIEKALAIDDPSAPSTNTLPSHGTTPAPASYSNDGLEDERMDFEGIEMLTQGAGSATRPQHRIDTSQLLQQWPTTESHLGSSQWTRLLPTYEQATELLDFYVANVCWMYHFLHVPTLRRQLRETYEQLGRDVLPAPSVLALICAIFALSTYFSRQSTLSSENLGRPGDDAHGDFVSLTSRALAEARHLDHPSLESMQAVLLLSSSLLLNMGMITNNGFRVLLTAMFTSAQALLIHNVDSPKNEKLRQKTGYDRVELEMKRRIWWHIASSDWIFALISGTKIGTYVVHSKTMHVKLPSNCDDAEITPEHSVDKPLSVPTEMTYFLLRGRLSLIFRHFRDSASDKGLDLDEVDYEQVLAFDRNINDFIDSIPYFLKMDPESRQRCVELDKQRPYLIWQRLMAQFGASTRMSGLHRPYIARGARDPKYAYSRMVCLRSARTVLEFEKVMRTEMPRTAMMPDPSKIWAMMYQVFFATMVLVMDYHFNKDEPRADERMEEIRDCCRRLEAAKEISTIAARGLEELKRVMRRWGLLTDARLNSRGRGNDGEAEGSEAQVWPNTVPKQVIVESIQEQDTSQTAADGFDASSWIDSWDFNVELDTDQWSALFQDLESYSDMM